LSLICCILKDCSGVAEAGLKWLRRAGFGKANDGNGVHPLQRLKITYDPQIRYSTFQFTITPAVAGRLPIPGGYYNSMGIYACVPDGRVDRKAIATTTYEGDTSADDIVFSKIPTHAISMQSNFVVVPEDK
jgi:hypothetical protein